MAEIESTTHDTPQFGEKLDTAKLVAYFLRCRRESEEYFEPMQEDWKKYHDCYYGDTLSKEDRAYLKETHRPSLDINLAAGTVDTIIGHDMSERKEVQFRGVDGDYQDETVAEIYTRIVRHYMIRYDGHRSDSDAILDALITGYGCAERYLDTSVVPIPVRPKHVPMWEIYPDPDAKEDGLADSKFVIRRHKWTLEQAQARWPDKAKEFAQAVHNVLTTLLPTAHQDQEWLRSYLTGTLGVEVWEFQYQRWEPKAVYEDPFTGERREDPLEEFEARKKAMGELWKQTSDDLERMPEQQPLPPEADPQNAEVDPQAMQAYQEQAQERAELEQKLEASNPDNLEAYIYNCAKRYRAWIGAPAMPKDSDVKLDKLAASKEVNASLLVLEHQAIRENSFSYLFVTGRKWKRWEDNRVAFFGVMRMLYDLQLYINRSAMLILELLGRGSKGAGFIEQGALVGSVDRFAKERATPGLWTVVRDGAIANGAIMPTPVVQMPAGIERFIDLLQEMITKVGGVTDWLKGTATQERSNVLISNLQQQNLTMLNPVFDPISAFRIQAGSVMAKMIYEYVPESEINEIIGAEYKVDGITHVEQPIMDPMTGQPQMDPMTGQPVMQEVQIATPGQLAKARDPFDFDVTSDLGQASPTQRQAVWQVLYQTNLLPQMMELGLPIHTILPELVRYLPIPPNMAKKLGDTLEQAMQAQEQMGGMGAPGGMPPSPTTETVQ